MRAVKTLSPSTDEQRDAKATAVSLASQLGATRWLIITQQMNYISTPLILVVVGWLLMIFFGFGIMSPRTSTSAMLILTCASAVSGAIFLILEMYTPLAGWIRISGRPLNYALQMMGS